MWLWFFILDLKRILKFKNLSILRGFFIGQIIIFYGQILKNIAPVQVHSDMESNVMHP